MREGNISGAPPGEAPRSPIETAERTLETAHQECLETALSQWAALREALREKNARLQELEAEVRALRALLNRRHRIASLLGSVRPRDGRDDDNPIEADPPGAREDPAPALA